MVKVGYEAKKEPATARKPAQFYSNTTEWPLFIFGILFGLEISFFMILFTI